jgi:hypothetical protein
MTTDLDALIFAIVLLILVAGVAADFWSGSGITIGLHLILGGVLLLATMGHGFFQPVLGAWLVLSGGIALGELRKERISRWLLPAGAVLLLAAIPATGWLWFVWLLLAGVWLYHAGAVLLRQRFREADEADFQRRIEALR